MNLTQSNITQTKGKDSYMVAVTKNVIVVALYFSINYINGTLLTIAVLVNLISYILYTINVSRYIAICNPLRHMQICTVCRTYVLIGLIWVLDAVTILPDLFILLATEPLSFFHSTIYCSRDTVFQHPYLLEKRKVSYLVYLSFVWFTLFYTYFRIMFTAKATGADAQKAHNTILLHGLQLLLTFISLFPMILNDIRFTSYIFVHILPRFISPIHLLCNKLKEKNKTQSS
uniref:G-protein coupled receptors family 1 profile domain-containing protein n=1 Tax=Pygocentrus nattereri TaxID=42514 RepID=A0A3B4CNP4_PYGNA